MKTEEMQVGELIPYERNAKKHDDRQIKNVMESIRRFGFAQPLVVDKNKVVIIGHCRLIAAKRLGLRTVPVLKMEELTEEQAQQLRLLDNKLNESEWDAELLAEDIPEIDWSGFDIDWEIEEMGDDAVDIVEVETPEPPKEPTAQVGDIYQLGVHRLICGDSTDPEVLKKLMDGAQADLLVTDPPYNVDYEAKEKALLKARPNKRVEQGQKTEIKNDSMDGATFRAFLIAAFTAAIQNMKPGAAFYIWHADTEGLNFRTAATEAGLKIRQCLVWVKQHFVLGRQDYQWIHESCLYGWTEGGGALLYQRPNKIDRDRRSPGRSKEEKEGRAAGVYRAIKITANNDHPYGQTSAIGAAPNNETGRAYGGAHKEQQQKRRSSTGQLRWERFNTYGLRAVGAPLLHLRAQPAIH